jgi:ATP-dependent Clp protease adaptor protein ClpS
MIPKMNVFIVLSLFFSMAGAFTTLPAGSASRQSSRTSVLGVSATRDVLVMMPATLEKEKFRTGGPAVLDRPAVERKGKDDSPAKERNTAGGEAWEVRIYNDGMNTREHVARALVQVTGLTEFGAYQTMMQAHQNGIAVVGRWCFEIAEMYNEGLQKNGIVSDIVAVDEEK